MPIPIDTMPYPQTLPDGTIAHLLELWQDRDTIDWRKEARFLWHVQGYGQKIFFPEDTDLASTASLLSAAGCDSSKSVEDCVAELQGGRAAAKAIPWNLILPIIIALIRKYL